MESCPVPSDLLASVTAPSALRRLTPSELKQLAADIREYLVATVSRTGGHLGPNLGVVELTIALHKVFNSPTDTILFDTGHQAYVHKLLTGRHDFSTLRQAGGLSGYPNRQESDHDVIENSHASTALSWAHGIALGKHMSGDESYTVALIGDGAMTGGMAWEALNNIAEDRVRRLIIVVNDNGRSYAPTIGGLHHHLNGLRTNPMYEKTLSQVKAALLASGKPGEVTYDTLRTLKRALKDVIAPQALFEDLGLKYIGPFDGHNIEDVTEALTQAKALQQPVIVHVRTEKGRGYTPAEQDHVDRFHAVGVIHPETGLPVAPSRFGWTSVFADQIMVEARKHPEIIGVTAAMMAPVGLGPFFKEFPDRVIDVGIAEQHAVTMCAGLAQAGMHPVFAVYATFLNRAFDQMLMDVSLHQAGVTFVLDRAGATGDDGASHNGMWDLALTRIIPSMELAAPRDEPTLRAALSRALQVDDHPTVVRYAKGSLPEPIPALESRFGFDILYRSDESSDLDHSPVVIVATGALCGTAVEAGRLLGRRKRKVIVVDPIWLYPVSSDLVELCRSAGAVVTVEDGIVKSGFGEELLASVAAQGRVPAWRSLGLPREFLAHQSRNSLLEGSGLSAVSIAETAMSL
ncbi:1-deoxy-D-xylulose-5-phosphate synthase [Boudabousia marimammalium]|uniref:1-deoxy-D-xylulose-5-phosphate synthase n=1 Tax=Boudabousia marimammalium TaxID=156892 RepID=A0A1Q5PRL8_9ACTO|nr:1-deoxy-D-xylulose-5-phosphate synthase [Boudabousia marimammalium]OKL50092.1 1-deoxy-D-xylulose-5-phosphate synthase [Boudabousia marimammalium]